MNLGFVFKLLWKVQDVQGRLVECAWAGAAEEACFARRRSASTAASDRLKRGAGRIDTKIITTTMMEKRDSLMARALNAESATISPPSPRGVIPQPTDSDSCRVIRRRRAGMPHPATFVRIAATVKTAPKMSKAELPPASGKFAWSPREMKKIGVKTAPRHPAPSVKSSRSGVVENKLPARKAPTTADSPITSATNAYKNVTAIARMKPPCLRPRVIPSTWIRTMTLRKK